MPKPRRKRKSFTSKIGPVDYKIVVEPIPETANEIINGLADSPRWNDPELTINSEQKEQSALNSAIHEILHAMFWDKREDWIKNRADQMSEALWKMGVRIPNWPK